jgi:hypothetical protein
MLSLMSQPYRFFSYLRCPKCKRMGTAELSDFHGGYSDSKLQQTTVVTLPEGFTVMPWASRVGSIDLLCDVSAGSVECGNNSDVLNLVPVARRR